MAIKGTVATIMALTVALGVWALPARADQAPGRGGPPAARVGEEVIGMDELEATLRARLAQVEQQRFELLRQGLAQLVGERLLAQEARRRGVPVGQLLKEEVSAKTPQTTDDEVATFITRNRNRLPPGDEGETKRRVRDYLRSQKLQQQRQAYVETLQAKTPVTIYLEEPESLRVAVRTDRGFVRGAPDARVVIVEFSDFQCPFCKTAAATVKQVVAKYSGRVKWIFRDFPIATIHPGAPKAHEAARCAAEQGKFWEYHDLLFERAPRHAAPELKRYADELKLDPAAFVQCFESGRHEAAVSADVEEGTSLGVTGTPTFYVNGRTLVGAQPSTAFEQLIESELKKATR